VALRRITRVDVSVADNIQERGAQCEKASVGHEHGLRCGGQGAGEARARGRFLLFLLFLLLWGQDFAESLLLFQIQLSLCK